MTDTLAAGGPGLDVALDLDLAGVPAVREQALGFLRRRRRGRRGRPVLVGPAGTPVAVPSDTLVGRLQQSVRGHHGSQREHIPQLDALVRHGQLRLDAPVSDVLPLADAPLAVERLQGQQGSPVRLVLTPGT